MNTITLITGASSGFGQAIARQLAEAGHRLILLARREARLRQLAEELPTPCHVLAMDVRETAAIARLPENLPAEFAAVDQLINNAGLALGLEPAHEASLDDWDTMLETNCKALVHMTRAFLPGMVARRRGHVVNMASIAGSYAYPGGNVYGASKAFVQQFSRNLRADLLGTPVRVTCIDPGLAETEFSLVRFHGDAQQADAVYTGTQPLTAEDVAAAVVWALQQPPHVNINQIELMPTGQAWGPLAVHRDSG